MSVIKVKLLLSIIFSATATLVTTSEFLSSNTSILFLVLCTMFYTSLSFFDSISSETTKELKKDVVREIDYFRQRVMSTDEISAESKEQLLDLFNAVELNFFTEVVSMDFLKSNSYSVDDSLAKLKHIGRMSIARYENGWEHRGIEIDDIKSFRKLTERDLTKFFESVSRIIKGEPFLYRRQKVFKREVLLLVKDVVYDYFMFVADKRHRGLV